MADLDRLIDRERLAKISRVLNEIEIIINWYRIRRTN